MKARYVNIGRMAELLNISRGTLRSMVLSGEIPDCRFVTPSIKRFDLLEVRDKTGVTFYDYEWPEVFSRKQAADYLGVSVRTLSKMVEEGFAPEPLNSEGRAYRYIRKAIDDMIHK